MVAGAVGLSACGGSGGDGSTKKTDAATPATTPAATAPAAGGGAPSSAARKGVIREGDRICRAARSRLVPLNNRANKAALSKDPALVYRRYTTISAQAAAVYAQTGTQLGALQAAPADQSEIDRLSALLGQTASIERQISAAAAAQNAARVQELVLQVNGVIAQFRSGAKAYGFHSCSSGGQTFKGRGNR